MIETKIQELCLEAINALTDKDVSLVDKNELGNLRPTDTGRFMSRFYIAFETMKRLAGVSGSESLGKVLI